MWSRVARLYASVLMATKEIHMSRAERMAVSQMFVAFMQLVQTTMADLTVSVLQDSRVIRTVNVLEETAMKTQTVDLIEYAKIISV